MADRLPPLTALRAFEAAARHLSFAKAADELAVTPAALSYQIKNLEDHLGAPLFRRLNRAVELTEAGRILLPQASEAFDALRRGWQATRRLQDTGVINITAGPAFTAKWLAPRMFRFTQANPDIELRFAATLRLLDFDRDNVDVAIRFGPGDDGALFSESLYRGFITPMMRPEIAARLMQPEDMLGEELIHDDSLIFLDHQPTWERWFAEAGIDTGPLKGVRFDQADHALDLALEGGGIVLGRASIATGALKTGALATPFDLALTHSAHYRLVCAPGTETRPNIARFRDWIHGEVAADLPLSEGRRMVHIG